MNEIQQIPLSMRCDMCWWRVPVPCRNCERCQQTQREPLPWTELFGHDAPEWAYVTRREMTKRMPK